MALGPRTPDLVALDTLLAVAHAGSQNAAVVELGISQQAVAQRISALQRLVGVHLVDRTRRGSSLTPEGEVVAQWAARVVDAAHALDLGLDTLRAGHRTRLRVAASLTVAEQLLPGWLVALREHARARAAATPEITLTAINSEHVADLVRAGDVDLGFVETPARLPGLRTRTVGRDELVVVVPPDHPLAKHALAKHPRNGATGRTKAHPLPAATLAATPLVVREAGSGTREALAAALRAAGLAQAPPVLELSTTAAVRAAVLAGAGPAVLSALVVADDVASGRLVVVPTTGLDLHRDLRAVWAGGPTPPAGPARDLLAIAQRRPA